MTTITWLDLGVDLILYSFLGWVLEATWYAVTRRRFYNRGVLTLPLLISYGVTFDLLVIVLPSLEGNYFYQYVATLMIVSVVESLSGFLMRRMSPRLQWGSDRERLFSGSGKGLVSSLVIAAAYYGAYLVLHPILMAGLALVPWVVELIVVLVLLALILFDFVTVLIAMRKGDGASYQKRQEEGSQGWLSARLFSAIWRRLKKAYPGIRETEPEEEGTYTFAKGLCFDKLIWVFLVCALLGDIIETISGVIGGQFFSRSSVLYGPFSFVWGLGGVLLTITLQPLAGKHDRYVFLAGFVIGGVYEYMCSLFTEIVFGTVFWDYSWMPLNIGGRTNVLYCFCWGALAVIWVKILYPFMSKWIEKLPAVIGKVITWVVVCFMVANALLTSAAMLRFDSRQVRPEPANSFEAFLDSQYDDDFMTHRWQNMVVTEKKAPQEEEGDEASPEDAAEGGAASASEAAE